MQKMISGLLIIVGIIHILPTIGILGAERLSTMYDIALDEPNLVILMQHRAALFGLLGLFLIASAFQPILQPYAFVAGFITILSFLYLAWAAPEINTAMRKIVIADLVAVTCLSAALFLVSLQGRSA